MERSRLASHNVIAAFPELNQAEDALDKLHRNEIVNDDDVSVLTRTSVEDEAEAGLEEEAADVTTAMAKGTVKGGVVGGVAGGALGFLAGTVALAIPGVGLAAGTGLFAAVLGGAAAGATTGGLAGAFEHLWEVQFLDALKEGRTLVWVHTDDEEAARRASQILHEAGPEKVDHLDERGELIQSE